MELGHPAIEHRSSPAGRWLRGRRVKLALLIAVAEGVLIVVDVIPGWLALVVGAGILVLHFGLGRSSGSDTVRQASWTAALSQVLVALVPLLAFALAALALVAVVVIAVVTLVVLLADRR